MFTSSSSPWVLGSPTVSAKGHLLPVPWVNLGINRVLNCSLFPQGDKVSHIIVPTWQISKLGYKRVQTSVQALCQSLKGDKAETGICLS